MVSIPVTTVSIQSAKPTTAYGVTPTAAIWGNAQILARAALSGIPDDAVVSSALLQFTQYGDWSGSKTIEVRRNTSTFSTKTTWNKAPSATATGSVSLTKSSPPGLTVWSWDVTTMVQAWLAGTNANYGWTMLSASGTRDKLRATNSADFPPVLLVEYTSGPTSPVGLHPSDGGVVSIAKPTLTAQVAGDTVSIQVQIDPAANGTTPGFDSGEVSTPAGLLDLTATAYAGLSNAASTQWRMRAKNPQGWSGWSSWVTFSRTNWGTLTVTSPGSTSEDDSPVVVATYTGTVTAWQAYLKNTLGKTIESSDWVPGDAMGWGSTISVGAAGVAGMNIRDDQDRVVTPGDPDYRSDTQAFTVTPSGVPDPIDDLTATQLAPKPAVILTGTRDDIPDDVAITRNGVRIDRVPGLDVFTGSGPYTLSYADVTAPMHTEATYTVTAIVNDEFSVPSGEATITPTCGGVWLYDTEDGSEVVVWGDGEATQEQPEQAIVHSPLSSADGHPQVIRRRLARYPREGALPDGSVLKDVMFGPSYVLYAADSEANLERWADQDAGHLYRLVMGNKNDKVILGNITLGEVSINRSGDRVVAVSADWWAQK